MASGTFDTLNPYTFKGTSLSSAPGFLQYGISELNEPLMVGTGSCDPSGDEPAPSYGMIAESVHHRDHYGSEERRLGKEWFSTGRSRWWQENYKTEDRNQTTQ